MTLSGTISHTALQTDFDAQRANLLANQQVGPFGFRIGTRNVAGLLSGTALSKRSVEFTMNDDQDLLALSIDAYGHATTASTFTARLVCVTDPYFFPAQALTLTQATTDDSGDRNRTVYAAGLYSLVRGFTYRLSVENSEASDAAVAARAHITLGTYRRRR